MPQRRIRQSHNQRRRRQQLQNQQQIFAQQPAQPGADGPLLEHPFPDKQRRRRNFQTARLETMEKNDQRQRRAEQKQCGGQGPQHKLPSHLSHYAAHLPQRLQNELIEGDFGRSARIVDVAAGAERFDLFEIIRQLDLIAAQQVVVEKKFPLAAGFDIEERDVAARLGLELQRVDDVDDQQLMTFRRQLFKSAAPTGGIEQVTDEDDETGMGEKTSKGMHRGAQIGLAGAGKFVEKTEQDENLFAPATKCERFLQRRGKRRAADSVKIFQPYIAERRGDLLGIVEFRRRPLGHRSTGIDQEINIQLLFGG